MSEYWPKNTKRTIYLYGEYTIAEILNRINEKWPNCNPESITLSSEYIHINCLTYDLYDSNDYKEFLVITNTDIEENG